METKSAQQVYSEKVGFTNKNKVISLSGNVEGFKTVSLSFMVSGKVDRLMASEGQSVAKGGLLASLDPTSYTLARNLANVQVKKAHDEYQRLKFMHEKNSLSESDLKKAQFALDEANYNYLIQNKNVSDTRIYSPISGILLSKKCEQGEVIEAGRTVLTVADIHKVKITAYLPENMLGQIKIGQQAKVEISALDKFFNGKVVEIAGVADQSTRTFVIKIEVDNERNIIRPGMIAEARITSNSLEPVITVPVSSVQNSNDNVSFIYVIDKNKAYKRNIVIGGLQGDRIEILSGLASDEVIVTKGQQKLVDGAAILINN